MWILLRDLIASEDCNMSLCYKGERGDYHNSTYCLVVETEEGKYKKEASYKLARYMVEEWK